MNVGDSVRHALDEWDRQAWDAAMLHACNAVDGTGKKRYPDKGVAGRFKATVRDSLDIYNTLAGSGINYAETRFPVGVKSDLSDHRPDIADLLYGIHRCTHGHGDELPDGFELTPYVNGIALFEGSRGKLRLSASAVLGLLGVAVFAPENHDQRVPNPNYNLSWGGYVFPINAWWGWQDHLRAVIAQDASPRVTLEFGDWWDDWVPVK